ncbi:hypothetical protein D3C71_1909440 [compost metagenome]
MLGHEFTCFGGDATNDPKDQCFLEWENRSGFVAGADGNALLHAGEFDRFPTAHDNSLDLLGEHFDELASAFGDVRGLGVIVPD